MNYDILNNADPRAISTASYLVLDAVQSVPAEVRVLGAAAFFILSCERLGLDPADAFRAITNLMNTKHSDIDHFAATRMYLKEEL